MNGFDHNGTGNGVGRRVRLFVVRGSANSRLAERNLRAFLDQRPEFAANVEIVDVSEQPAEALSAGVYVTPTLIRIPAASGGVAVGTLDDPSLLEEILA
jgi:hypothetical protein